MEIKMSSREEQMELITSIQSQLDLPAHKRIEIIEKGIWVRYPLADELIDHLERLLNQAKRPRMLGRSLIGATGNGKTTIIQAFMDIQKKKQGIDKEDSYEFLYVEAPEVPSVKSLYLQILSAINMPKTAKKGTAEQLKDIVIEKLGDLDVKMLFIDEIHNFLQAQSDRIIQQCLNVLKGLSNRLKIPIILIGTEEAEKVIRRDSQVLSRYRIIRLSKWKLDKSFQTLLNTFERVLPLKNESNLHKKTIAKLIYQLSGGVLGEVANIITESAIEAISRGTERISYKLITDLHKDKFAPF